jgi:membrane fusion protein, multidrug efflux system
LRSKERLVMTELTSIEIAEKRRRGLIWIACAVGAAALVWSGWHWFVGRHHLDTDNAYVVGNVLQITPQVNGMVLSIQADETDFVHAGQTLVKLDEVDARIALEQAQAQLAQSVRESRSLFSNSASLIAQVGLRQADYKRAQDDLNRRSPLVSSGAVSQEEFDHARAQLAIAESSLTAAKEQLNAAQTQTEGTTVETHPGVLRSAAKLREAYLALQRVNLKAPIDGHVAKRNVQVGQRVQLGAPLMTVVALNQLWVDANFKESQLKDLRIGQPAELQADVYGKNIVFHGKVLGLGAGTGAAFSLLPAQNATGNWIKVVQRVPVRIALDPQELAAHPLRVGLSMDVMVDTADQSGKILSDLTHEGNVAATGIYDSQQVAADAEVARIIAANMGSTVTPVMKHH